MAKREGLWSTLEKVRSKLDSYKTQGYSASGVVVESGCDEFAVGDRVACAGSGGNHAEINIVPKNLAIKIPDEVSFEDASFTTLGSIALQGVRQAKINLGENVAVVGLGLIGQITVQLLKAAGCRVIGFDINKKQFDLAKEFGADFVALSDENSVALAESFSRGVGLDAVIITASTSSNAPMEFALNATRKKGRIVVVGVTGMNIHRSPFYEKELEFKLEYFWDRNENDKGTLFKAGLGLIEVLKFPNDNSLFNLGLDYREPQGVFMVIQVFNIDEIFLKYKRKN